MWLSSNVVVISDTQFHENKGDASRFLGKGADLPVDVTIRTAQQNLGSMEVLRKVISETPTDVPIIHLGDAIDLSCDSEWETFIDIMQQANTNWVLVPGNHDGFVAGNAMPVKGGRQLTITKDSWRNLCNKGRNTLDNHEDPSFDKNEFLRNYLTVLSNRYPAHNINADERRGFSCKEEAEFLACLSWSIDRLNPWRSYLLQAVSLPTVKDQKLAMVLFDTANYYTQPWLAGETARITVKQLHDASKFLRYFRASNYKVAFGGHHPMKDLRFSRWGDDGDYVRHLLTSKNTVPFYLSSHTHSGYWDSHSINGVEFTELNTGSITDAPVYYRDLKFGLSPDNHIVVDSSINDLGLMSNSHLCHGIELPTKDQMHSIESQDNGDLVSAIKYFFGFWKSKHKETEYEMLVLKDLMNRYVPAQADHSLAYQWVPNCNVDKKSGCAKLSSRKDITNEIDYLSSCDDQRSCPHIQKAKFTIALEEFVMTSTTNVSGLRNELMCLSIKAAEKDMGESNAGEIRQRIQPSRIEIRSSNLISSSG